MTGLQIMAALMDDGFTQEQATAMYLDWITIEAIINDPVRLKARADAVHRTLLAYAEKF
jgi:hypothetical protein